MMGSLLEKVKTNLILGHSEDDALLTSAHTIQAFTDQQYQLILENPEFFLQWKEKWGLNE